MSATGPLSAVPGSAGYQLPGVGLELGGERASSRRGLAAVAGMVLTGCLIALGAAHTPSLLPEPISFDPGSLGGLFNAVGLNLHAGGLIAVLAVMFASYLGVVALSGELSARSVLMAIAALNAFVLLAPPLLSTDIFSYQAYARMGAIYSINPYTHGPHGIFPDPVTALVGADWSYYPSVYGPLFTVFSYLLAPLSIVASVFAYKGLAAVSSIALVAVVWRCARLRGVDPVRAAALVGLNPLLLVYGVGGGHNDLVMLLAMVGALYAILASREGLGGTLALVAVGLKLTAGLVLPFALVAGGPRRGRPRRELAIAAAGTGAVITGIGVAVFGSGLLKMFATLNQAQSAGVRSIPGVIAGPLAMPGAGHVVGYALAGAFLLVCCWLLRRVWLGRLDWIAGAGWAMLTMLVASSSLLPWYVAWLLPLAALGHDRRLTRMTLLLTAAVLAVQLIGYIPHNSIAL
ncbi:MAG: polyprenol phosphomannose-dependent alpha 1,6 mannosyltransferase MptB [Solirubrobacteraceae bacterium]